MNFRSISDRDCTRACLKNHFRKLGLAAHEKPFSDTLCSISLIISDFVDQL